MSTENDTKGSSSSSLMAQEDQQNFRRFVKFGVVDASLLTISFIAGFSLDARIARTIGLKGYGPIVGAGLGNAMADFVAAMPEGKGAALGVGLGALTPLAPVGVAMMLRKEFTGNVVKVAGGCSVLLCVGTFIHGYFRPTH
mmetsp:Transcript_10301/g.14129  ORF Transcript_10301/g.14129 Transcript_10301/m.14129 type:complete len:141 (+) Transcript_10301:68-490(+)